MREDRFYIVEARKEVRNEGKQILDWKGGVRREPEQSREYSAVNLLIFTGFLD